MKILIVASHYAVCSARYAADAFTRLGHDVKHVGPAMGRHIWGMDVPQEYVWTPDEILYDWTESLDLIICMDSDPAFIADLPYQRFRENNNAPIIVWGVDNHVRSYRNPNHPDLFSHYFLAHRNVSVMNWEEVIHGGVGGATLHSTLHYPDMTHLPCAYDPVYFTPSPIPYAERAYDVCMIGVMYPERWRLVNELKAAGIKVLAGTGLIYEAYRDAYHNARISLCSSSNGDVAQRVFETAALGCVVVSDKCPDFDILQPLGIWTIEPDVSIVEQVRGILADPVKAQEQIALSQAWAAPQTWDARAKVIVEWWDARNAS